MIVKTARQMIADKQAELAATLSTRKDVRTPGHNCPDVEIMPVRRFQGEHSLTTLMLCGCRHAVYKENDWRDGYVSFCLAHGQMTTEIHQFIREFCLWTTEQWVKAQKLRGSHEASE